MNFKKIIVTGGCGFIGSNFISYILNKYKYIKLLNIDALTYAANNNLNSEFKKFKNYKFKKINLKNFTILKKINPTLKFSFDNSQTNRHSIENRNFVGSNKLFRKLTGWKPRFNLINGIKKTYKNTYK